MRDPCVDGVKKGGRWVGIEIVKTEMQTQHTRRGNKLLRMAGLGRKTSLRGNYSFIMNATL